MIEQERIDALRKMAELAEEDTSATDDPSILQQLLDAIDSLFEEDE